MKKLIFSSLILLSTMLGTAAQETQSPLWLRYPAISPDGNTIAFSFKGDIYTVDAKGGVATPLTTNAAYDYMPVWSPSGEQIAFASNRFGSFDIFTVSAQGGTPKRLTFHSGNELPSAFSRDGQTIIFGARIADTKENILFPDGMLTELYAVPVQGGRTVQLLTTPAENAAFSNSGTMIAYHDRKGYEDAWRKHHQSSVTRDVWIYDTAVLTHKKITSFGGEDRNPVFSADDKTLYYLTEQFGSFNVAAVSIERPEQAVNPKPVSSFKKHPVRFLTIAANNLLCYSYNGELYTQMPGNEAQKVNVSINADQTETALEYDIRASGATEMAVSPDGKEVAFIIRGEVFVTATDYATTKRITATPEQERSVSFSPDGKKLLYAGERNGKWNIYQTSVADTTEAGFSLATLLKEEIVVDIPEEAFQPAWSPDGNEVAFLKDRQTLCVKNLKTGIVREVLPSNYNYSYADGDQYFQWSPDGKWFLVSYFDKNRWTSSDVGLVKADGSEIHNLTESGYSDNSPRWMMDGKVIIWFSDRNGLRSHGSWGSQSDVYAMFLTQEAFDEFKLPKHEWKLLKEKKEKEKAEAKKDEGKDTAKGKKKKVDANNEEKNVLNAVTIDFDNLDERKVRLTINSSSLSDAVLSPDGESLYYLCRFEKGFDLWVNNLKDNETKLLVKIDGYAGDLHIDKEGKNLFLTAGGRLKKIEIAGNKQTDIAYSAEYEINYPKEREYIYEHAWRQVSKKFYDPNIHGLDWAALKADYARFLPFINNNFDFAELCSELLGELNASHTGMRYFYSSPKGDRTASLGAFYSKTYKGAGILIDEVMEKSPLVSAKSKIKAGVVIEKIDGIAITENSDFYQLLNHKEGKNVLLGLYSPATGERWNETVKPVSQQAEQQLLYKRWVKTRNKKVEELSGGRIGYVHVRGMDSESYREVYSELLGRHSNKEAVIVDTRFNGGGWLHDDLATLLAGRRYADFMPRGQYIGSEPIAKWYKPSIVIMGEGNYSDAHGFPFTYKSLNIGKLLGMPVPGTMTAVWWETQQDRSLVFGIPQMGVKDLNGNYLENHQLEPDIKVAITPEDAAAGRDTQIEKAVEELLKQLDAQK